MARDPLLPRRTWEQAIGYCDGLTLGGVSDWRLPTRIEMTSIVDFTRSPAIDRGAFPGARGGFHKTSSDWILTIRQAGAGAGRDYAWAFNLSDGIVSNAYSKATAASLRCVRGNGEGEAPSSPAVAPPDQYTVVSPGEVMDRYTGLVWQQGYSPATMAWAEAEGYCTRRSISTATRGACPASGSSRPSSTRRRWRRRSTARCSPTPSTAPAATTGTGARTRPWGTPRRPGRSNLRRLHRVQRRRERQVELFHGRVGEVRALKAWPAAAREYGGDGRRRRASFRWRAAAGVG